jgi:hypothetical protein
MPAGVNPPDACRRHEPIALALATVRHHCALVSNLRSTV